MQRNLKPAIHQLEPRKQNSHSLQARQVGGGGCHLKGAPLDHCCGGKHRHAVVFADSNVRAASQEKAEIRTGERLDEGGLG
jgi:hypothetical protein